MPAMIPNPDKPGEFFLPGLNEVLNLSQWDEDDLYDTMVLPVTGAPGLQGAIGTVRYFTDLAGKTRVDTNLSTSGRIPGQHTFIVLKAGLFCQSQWGQEVCEMADIGAIYAEGSMKLDKNRKTQIEETHLWGRATGYGLVAYGVDLAAPGVVIAPVSNGVASPAAIPPLLVPFKIGKDDEFEGFLYFGGSGAQRAFAAPAAATWASHQLSHGVATKYILHGFMQSPATR